MAVKLSTLGNAAYIEVEGSNSFMRPKGQINVDTLGDKVRLIDSLGMPLTEFLPYQEFKLNGETAASDKDFKEWVGSNFFDDASSGGGGVVWVVDADGMFEEGVTDRELDSLFPNPVVGQTFVSLSTRYMVQYMGREAGSSIWRGELFSEI